MFAARLDPRLTAYYTKLGRPCWAIPWHRLASHQDACTKHPAGKTLAASISESRRLPVQSGNDLVDRIARHHTLSQGRRGQYEIRTHIGVRYDEANICCHDLAAWKEDRAPLLSKEGHLTDITPDWVCDVVSLDRDNQSPQKLELLHHRGVALVWMVDPEGKDLTVLEWQQEGYSRTHFHWGPAQ